jgi:hypothetical protein
MTLDPRVVGYVNSVAGEAEWLREQLGGADSEAAAASLWRRAAVGLEDLRGRPEETEPDLATILGEASAGLSVARMLLAADQATGPKANDDARTELDRSIARLTAEQTGLETLARLPAAGFAARIDASPDLPSAVRRLGAQAQTTLDTVVDQTAETVGFAFGAVLGPWGPVLGQALHEVGDALRLDELAGEFAAAARQAIEWAMQRLLRLLRSQDRLLVQVEERVGRLLRATDLKGVLATVVNTTTVSAEIAVLLARPGLERSSLDTGTERVIALTDRYTTAMRWVRRLLTVLGALVAATVVLHAGLAIPILYMTVVCAALASAGWVEGDRGFGAVGSIRSIVRESSGGRP